MRREFNRALLDDLTIAARALLCKAVLCGASRREETSFFRRAIDLGCGTGLAAARLRDGGRSCRRLRPVAAHDRARRAPTGLYDRLEVADMVAGPARRG